MEAQEDVPKSVAPAVNLGLAILVCYASLLKSKYIHVDAQETFTLKVWERSILCLTGKRSFKTGYFAPRALFQGAEAHVVI